MALSADESRCSTIGGKEFPVPHRRQQKSHKQTYCRPFSYILRLTIEHITLTRWHSFDLSIPGQSLGARLFICSLNVSVSIFLTGTAEKIVQVVVSRSHSVREDQRLSFDRCKVHVTSQRLHAVACFPGPALNSFFHVNFNGTRRPQRYRTNEIFINGIKINFMIEMSPDKNVDVHVSGASASVAAEEPNKKKTN